MRITKPTPQRRHIYLSIATISTDPDDIAGAFSSLTGRIVCISMLIDDGRKISELRLVTDRDEGDLLNGFWTAVRLTDRFIGSCVSGFTLPFILQRTWILNIRPVAVIDEFSRSISETDLCEMFHVTARNVFDEEQQKVIEKHWKLGEIAHLSCLCQERTREDYESHCMFLNRPLPVRFVELGVTL
jgi:hypothetical protein